MSSIFRGSYLLVARTRYTLHYIKHKHKNIMHRHLKLHHHKHTGKLIHHRHTSYWALVLLVLISGATLFMMERTATADDLVVTATVPAPIPSEPAIITAPDNNSVISDTGAIELSGACPVVTPSVIVAVYRGNELLGSTSCTSSGRFSLLIMLRRGTQTLVAHIVTITGQTGPVSEEITITYAPPEEPETPDAAPVNPGKTTKPPAASGVTPSRPSPLAGQSLDLFIHLNSPILTYRPHFPTQFQASFSGGTLPYTVHVNWGDGKSSTIDILDNDVHVFSHIYQSDTITQFSITVTDSSGSSMTREYAVVNVSRKVAAAPFGPTTMIDTISEHAMDVPIVLYALLLVTLLGLWRYEHIHHRQRVGIPMHYHWQHKKHTHK